MEANNLDTCVDSLSDDDGLVYVPTSRRYAFDHPFFLEGDRICNGLTAKQLTVDIDEEDLMHSVVPDFSCNVAGCMKIFSTVYDYEWHYNNTHRHVCKDCKKLFPTAYLLECHVLEKHDSMFQLLIHKQNMFKCLVEGCKLDFKSAEIRKNHLIKDHNFSSNFRFGCFGTADISKSRKSQLKSKTKENEDLMEVTPSSSAELTAPTERIIVYSPKKIPKNICFGYGTSKGFMQKKETGFKGKNKKNWHQRKAEDMDTSVNIEAITFDDLMTSLPAEGGGEGSVKADDV
ncbi:hypothetical protein CHUAL_001717 [Chamberlinius hualienensis]